MVPYFQVCCLLVILGSDKSLNVVIGSSFFDVASNSLCLDCKDTVGYQNLLAKLNHYEVREAPNDWFESNVPYHKQHMSIYCFDSGFAAITSCCYKLKFSSRTLSNFITCKQAIKLCKVPHFADDTHLGCPNKTTKTRMKICLF